LTLKSDSWPVIGMRDHRRVQLQLAIDPEHKDLVRQLARSEGLSMTRYLVRLVLADRDRAHKTPKGDPARSPSTFPQERKTTDANSQYTEAAD
jgi:hypothetical protein